MFLKTRQQLFWIQAKTGAADLTSVSLRFCYLLPRGFGYFRPSLCCTSLWNHTVIKFIRPQDSRLFTKKKSSIYSKERQRYPRNLSMRNSKCRKSIKRPFLSTTMIHRCSSGSKMSTFYSFLCFTLHVKLTRVLWDSHALVSIKEGNVTGLPCKSGLLLSSLLPFRKSSGECAACWVFVRPWWVWNSFCCFQLCPVQYLLYFKCLLFPHI